VVGTLASDLVAAVQTLRQQNGVNAARVGVLGASQAGWVMPLAASQSADIKFMAAIVGPTVPVNVLYDYASNAENGLATFDQLSQAIAAYNGPRGFDPLPALRSLTIPAIWLMATQDRVVPTRESVAIVNDLVATSSKPFRVLQYPGGHEVRASTAFYGDLFAWLETVR
jgi:dienelactone hydrolase